MRQFMRRGDRANTALTFNSTLTESPNATSTCVAPGCRGSGGGMSRFRFDSLARLLSGDYVTRADDVVLDEGGATPRRLASAVSCSQPPLLRASWFRNRAG